MITSSSVHTEESDVSGVAAIERFKKNIFSGKFQDPAIQLQFLSFQRERSEAEGYVVPVILVNLLTLINLGKYALLLDKSLPSFWNVASRLFLVSFTLGFLGLFASILFTVLFCRCFEKKLKTLLGNRFQMCRVVSMFGSLLLMITSNGTHLIGRTIMGDCEGYDDYPPYFCNHMPGSPPTFHFMSIILGCLYCFIAGKSILPFNCHLTTWAVSSVFLTADTHLEHAKHWLRTLGVALGCLLLLFTLQTLLYQQMTTFEYYYAFRKSMISQIKDSELRSDVERTQLKLVLANVAHDLKTPLQSFIAGVHSMKDLLNIPEERLSDSSSSMLHNSQQSAASGILQDMEASYAFMTMQINRALDVSKSDSNVSLLPKLEVVYLKDLIAWVFKIMSSIQSEIRLKLVDADNHASKYIKTDKVWLQENLLCLLSNAVKYSQEDTIVVLRVSIAGQSSNAALNLTNMVYDQLLFEVEDDGVGIPQEQREKLFLPFSQAQRRAGGTGLGLFSLALRVRTLGGVYGMTQPVNKRGALFFFTIPFADEAQALQADDPNKPRKLSLKARRSMSSFTRPLSSSTSEDFGVEYQRTVPNVDSPSVLIVDDSAITVKVLSRAVSKTGALVHTASDGFGGLQLMKRYLYTMVIMDIQMPVMDGLEAVRKLREWESSFESDRRRQYILGASACMDEAAEVDAISVGMDDYVTKPIDLPYLLGCITSLSEPMVTMDLV